MVLLVWLLFLRITCTYSMPSCTDSSNGGYLAHPSDCTLFYQCDHGVAVLRQCAPSTVFDVTLITCVRGSSQQCPVTSVTSTTAAAVSVSYQADLHFPTLNYSRYTSAVDNPVYTRLAKHCTHFIRDAILKNDDLAKIFQSVYAIGSRAGSVIMEVGITFAESDNQPGLLLILQNEVETHLAHWDHEIADSYVDDIFIYGLISNDIHEKSSRATVMRVAAGLIALIALVLGVPITIVVVKKCRALTCCLKMRSRTDGSHTHHTDAHTQTSFTTRLGPLPTITRADNIAPHFHRARQQAADTRGALHNAPAHHHQYSNHSHSETQNRTAASNRHSHRQEPACSRYLGGVLSPPHTTNYQYPRLFRETQKQHHHKMYLPRQCHHHTSPKRQTDGQFCVFKTEVHRQNARPCGHSCTNYTHTRDSLQRDSNGSSGLQSTDSETVKITNLSDGSSDINYDVLKDTRM